MNKLPHRQPWRGPIMCTASFSWMVCLDALVCMFISLALKIFRPSYNADTKSTAIHEPTNTKNGERKMIKRRMSSPLCVCVFFLILNLKKYGK